MSEKILFSLLLPTRDRPLLVDLVLLSLTKQKYKNFEVIVSDNYIHNPCSDVCDKYKNIIKIKYVHPPSPLSMAQNYNNALSYASGDYILALEDKSALFPFALSALADEVSRNPFEIINFLFDAFLPIEGNFEKGIWVPAYAQYPKEKFNPKKFFKQRLKFPIKYEKQPVKLKIRNKILIGCWSRLLIDRIQKTQVLFQPLSPDYTSMALGSIFSKTKSLDMGRSLGLGIKSDAHSNGMQASSFAKKAQCFIAESDPDQESLRHAPFGDTWFIQCVSLACDFIKVLHNSSQSNKFRVNLKNLSLRASEELKNFKDLSSEEKAVYESLIPRPSKYYEIFDKIRGYIYSKYHPFSIMLYLKVNILGRLGIPQYKSLLNHRTFCASYHREAMPFLEVLRIADEHYEKTFPQ